MRHFAAVLSLAVLGALAGTSAASAAMLGDPSVSYRAQRTVTIDGRTYSGPVYAAPGHQRHEQDLFGMHEVFLLDTQAARGFLVLPGVHTYVVFPFPPLMAELDSPDLRRVPVGEENVGGLRATKYQVDHQAQDGSRAQGYIWVSRAGVLAKLDVKVTRASGRPMAVAMELSQVVTGPVDPAVFALPQGFVQLPADALGPLLGAGPGGERRAGTPPQ